MEAFDEGFRGRPKNIVVRDLTAFFGLDPFRAQPVGATPLLEHRPQPDHVQEWLFAAKAADGGSVIGVEVAVDGDAARLRESDRLLYLPALKVFFAQIYFRLWYQSLRWRTCSFHDRYRSRPIVRFVVAPHLMALSRGARPGKWDGMRTGCTAAAHAPVRGRSRPRRCGSPRRSRALRPSHRRVRSPSPHLVASRRGAVED